MIVQYMKEEDILAAIAGHTNVISRALEEKASRKNFSCLRCGDKTVDKLLDKNIFIDGEILPNYYAECTNCLAVYNPTLKLEISPPKK